MGRAVVRGAPGRTDPEGPQLFSVGHSAVEKRGPFALASNNFLRLFPFPPDDSRVTARFLSPSERPPLSR